MTGHGQHSKRPQRRGQFKTSFDCPRDPSGERNLSMDARARSRHRDSSQDSLDRMVLFDAGQSHVEPLELEAQPAVVDAQAVQDRGVQVVDVHRVVDDVVAEFVGLAVTRSLA